ncbi:dehydrogenase/reductase SDR family protein 7-like isoform X2 [Cylas formicarius]|nr:dehydrogenase/reductase SDR family protein 7-like isoform X2 [Cylas formicarius]
MYDARRLFQSFQVAGPVSLGLGISLILFKMFGAVCLRKGYNKLVGKVVVITGASSGLGEALAHEFYKHGCLVVLCARRRQELERVREDLLHTHSNMTTYPPVIMPLDLGDIRELPRHVEKILAITGKIDILVNNGGCSSRGSVLDTSIEVDEKIMLVNYFGTVAMTKAVLKDMVARREGHIVFVSSVQGLIAIPERSSYSASKHAMQAFSDSLRAEVAAHDLSVTTVSPGYVRTKLSENALAGNGSAYGRTDEATASGYSPEYVAARIVRAVVRNEKEAVICPLLPRIVIFARKLLPFLYFYVMQRRARASSLKALAGNTSQ